MTQPLPTSINDSVETDYQPLEWDELGFPARVALKRKSQESFLNFTRIYYELLQGDRMLINWHHRLMAAKVDDSIAGRLNPRNLLVNVPPGGTKTEFFSIHVPAYLTTLVQRKKLKRFRNLNISYADTLIKRNSRRTRDIVQSKEFQEFWPVSFGVNQAEEWDIVNSKGRVVGQSLSRGAGGQIVGSRGGYHGKQFSGSINIDDFNKPDDMFSETKRKASNRILVNTIRSRRGDKSKYHPTPVWAIQQRLHTDDASGFMLSGGMGMPFHHVVVPALVCEKYIQSLEEPFRSLCWADVKDSESIVVGGVRYWSYWPDMEDVSDLVRLWEKDEYTFLSQYMQDPKSLKGEIVDTGFFMRHETLPPLVWRAVYVDTNSGKIEDYNDYTVFTLAGMGTDGRVYIIDVERGRWDPEDLLQTAGRLWDRWKPTDPKQPARLRYMSIEDKQAGQGLITTLKKRKSIPIKEIPRGTGQNKLVRCLNVLPQVKTGMVSIPKLYRDDGEKIIRTLYHAGNVAGPTDWVPAALKEVADFSPDDSHDHDDIWDTWMDAIDDMLISGNTTSVGSML